MVFGRDYLYGSADVIIKNVSPEVRDVLIRNQLTKDGPILKCAEHEYVLDRRRVTMFTATCNQAMYNILKEYQGREISPGELLCMIPDKDKAAVSELYDTDSRLSLTRYLSVYSMYALNKEPDAFVGAALISEDMCDMTLCLLNGCSTPIIKRVFPMLEGIAGRMAGSSDSQIISYLRNHKNDKAWFLDVFRREVVQKYGKYVLS